MSSGSAASGDEKSAGSESGMVVSERRVEEEEELDFDGGGGGVGVRTARGVKALRAGRGEETAATRRAGAAAAARPGASEEEVARPV